MRFKYYLRGIGIGVTLATLLLTISFYFGRDFLYNKSLTDEEIIEKASALGMVMPEGTEEEAIVAEEEISSEVVEEAPVVTEEVTSVGEEEISAESSVEQTVEDSTAASEDEVITYVPFTVRAGESSEVICSHLKKAGLIDDSEEFNKYLNKCKVDNLIQNGTFYVKQGSTYDDLVAVLVNKDVRTTTPPKN
ncbi:hypothetical protein SAMN04487831_101299 [Pseudobutyrivibrio sp. UC1225]|uniref:endolytic transglycosylase MltG n=1 Tax=Pseudobutyrivibrio sp. UC1225 TaxID=1798185 RepID=UPI0008EB6C92|nr:endolytic transglycosylase MltG [Pseudobutyrivibrio sp. UC1225]SFN46711.1 hypothetical protein SAMN04487831_101299 [Pseudobutyrivibrio sp. UC1225]